MKNMYKLLLIAVWAALALVSVISCSSITPFLVGSNTSLQSTSLAAANALRARGIAIAGTSESGNWLITPTKISGKVLSIVLPSTGGEDEGIVPFGSGRPDIAPTNSTLYDFDLSVVTTLNNPATGLKPGFVGGRAEQLILLFGYFDVVFDHNGTSRTIRFVYGDTDPYQRGDKLLLNASGESTGKYYWYNLSSEAFVPETASRPASVAFNANVKNFSDPVRPNLHYFMLGANLKNCTDYDGGHHDYITLNKSVIESSDLYFTVDFDVRNAVVFTGVSSEAAFNALSDAELLQKFDMIQNTSGWGNTNLDCSISFEARTKFK